LLFRSLAFHNSFFSLLPKSSGFGLVVLPRRFSREHAYCTAARGRYRPWRGTISVKNVQTLPALCKGIVKWVKETQNAPGPDRGRGKRLCFGEGDGDGGAGADLALQVDARAVQKRDVLDDGQPQAG